MNPAAVARGAPGAHRRAIPLAVGALALLVALLLGASLQSQSRALARLDDSMQRWVLAHQSPAAHGLALAVTVAGGITGMRLLAVGAAAGLWRRVGWRTAASIVLTPLLAELLSDGTKRWYARPRPVGLGQGVDATYAFPSAHAAVSAATCLALAWLCRREGLLTREAALVIAIGIPMLVGASRVFLNVHWTSDVLGGWSGGVAVAALAVAAHEPKPAGMRE